VPSHPTTGLVQLTPFTLHISSRTSPTHLNGIIPHYLMIIRDYNGEPLAAPISLFTDSARLQPLRLEFGHLTCCAGMETPSVPYFSVLLLILLSWAQHWPGGRGSSDCLPCKLVILLHGNSVPMGDDSMHCVYSDLNPGQESVFVPFKHSPASHCFKMAMVLIFHHCWPCSAGVFMPDLIQVMVYRRLQMISHIQPSYSTLYLPERAISGMYESM